MKLLIFLQLLSFSEVLRILLLNTLNPWASHRTRDQVSHPYNATGKNYKDYCFLVYVAI
jgi:hypothetical protein